MLRKTILGLVLAASIALMGGYADAADPTMSQVYQAAEAGKYREAQDMMDQVLRDHPNSAKAHFVEAELLAREGRLANAQSELAVAERLEPGLPFARPEAVRQLKARLASEHRPGAAVLPSVAGSSFPWGLLLLVAAGVALIVVVARRMRRPSTYAQSVAPPNYGAGAGVAQPYPAGGATPMAPAGGMGSGILGGLATGAAVGAGVVAGEALMHRMLDGPHSDSMVTPAQASTWETPQPQAEDYDMGGSDFGVSDTSSWDDGSVSGSDDWS